MAFRVFNERATLLAINGQPTFLGALVSTGAAVNNATTATPFNDGVAGRNVTLAGKVLLLQTTAAGLILPSTSASMVAQAGTPPIVALQSVLPPLQNTAPGVALVSGERVVVIMGAQSSWLQWLPVTGSANLLVWELS